MKTFVWQWRLQNISPSPQLLELWINRLTATTAGSGLQLDISNIWSWDVTPPAVFTYSPLCLFRSETGSRPIKLVCVPSLSEPFLWGRSWNRSQMDHQGVPSLRHHCGPLTRRTESRPACPALFDVQLSQGPAPFFKEEENNHGCLTPGCLGEIPHFKVQNKERSQVATLGAQSPAVVCQLNIFILCQIKSSNFDVFTKRFNVIDKQKVVHIYGEIDIFNFMHRVQVNKSIK